VLPLLQCIAFDFYSCLCVVFWYTSLILCFFAVALSKTVENDTICCMWNCQALNNLTTIDDNKMKIVEAGALPLYVLLLSTEHNVSVQTAAAHGLWSLAFLCKDSILQEPGCLLGRYLCSVKVTFIAIFLIAWNVFTVRYNERRHLLVGNWVQTYVVGLVVL